MKFRKFLCKIGIHKFEMTKIKKLDDWTFSYPTKGWEKCKYCKLKRRYMIDRT